MEPTRRESALAHLTLWDAVSIILGIIIGVGIFKTPSDVFQHAPGPVPALIVWLVGGLLALTGALCFAELASTYPRSGGEYVYLTRSFGSLIGYLFAWAQLTVIRPGGIGAMAFIFAHEAIELWKLGPGWGLWIAAAVVLVLTLVNIVGVTLGKQTQNLLTVAKVLGLVAIVIAGMAWHNVPAPSASEGNLPVPHDAPVDSGWFVLAMIFVLWTYAGWHEAAYIAAEVKDPRRNIPRALILGTLGVMVIYLLVNLSLWNALGFEGARSPNSIHNVIGLVLPSFGPQAFSILVMISALGALNGMIFTTARIYSEFGADHRLFQPLSHWSKRLGTPVRALATQGAISLALVVGVSLLGHEKDTFGEMVAMTAAVFWLFFLLTGIALFVLRSTDAERERPFRVPLYPWLPLLFCLSSAYMMVGAILYKPNLSLMSLLILTAGLPFYFWPKKLKRHKNPAKEAEPVGAK